MATYRLDGFKFNRANLRGIDSDCLKGINGYLNMAIAEKPVAKPDHAAELYAALENLRTELRKHVKFDVKKHYSLMVADVAADKALINAAKANEPKGERP